MEETMTEAGEWRIRAFSELRRLSKMGVTADILKQLEDRIEQYYSDEHGYSNVSWADAAEFVDVELWWIVFSEMDGWEYRN